MTENEARKLITKFCEDRMNFARGRDMSDKELEDFCKFSDALNLSVYSLEEIQQYRAIGTVEECREARERQRAKKPVLSAPCKSINYYLCPNCNKILNINKPFCCDCGSGIDWSEEDV